MLDKFDYVEPSCPLCDGKEFYYPQKDAPLGTIPLGRIIDKVDSLFAKNDYKEAGRLLEYWRDEAVDLKDKRGELAMESELVGYYRKQNQGDKALSSAGRALSLTDELGQGEMASGATIFINCATAYKAFGKADAALPLYKRAEQIYKKVLSPEDRRFGGLYNNMALALAELESYEEAEAAYLSALTLMEKVQGGEAESAISYINLAHMYESWGKQEKIPGCMERAYALLTSDSLPHDGYYAFVLEKCAPSFGYFGNVSAYRQLKKESERIYAGA